MQLLTKLTPNTWASLEPIITVASPSRTKVVPAGSSLIILVINEELDGIVFNSLQAKNATNCRGKITLLNETNWMLLGHFSLGTANYEQRER